MNHNRTLLLLIILVSTTIFSQQIIEKPEGKVSAKIYFNYHFDTSENVEQKSAFELTRAYLGYKRTLNNKFSAKILLDAGKGAGGSDYTIFIKNARLDYKANNWLTLTAGIFGLKQFKAQEDFWGYRYLYKSLEDEYKFGSSADAGILASMKVSKKITIDVLAVNGDGYKRLQDKTGYNRYGINFIYKPVSGLLLKAYYDFMKGVDVADSNIITTVSNIALFAGYEFNRKIRFGAEYNLMQNAIEFNKPSEGKDLKGLSFITAYIINSKWNVFARYDMIRSSRNDGETIGWNNEEDGNTLITGVEFSPIKGVNTSVNFRHRTLEDTTLTNPSFIYLNLEYVF